MNKRIMDRCWPLQMPATAKSVLIALSAEADDQGVCVPALSVLMSKTCFERTAVIDAVKFLETRNALWGQRFPGKPTVFTVQPDKFESIDPFSSPSAVPVTSTPNVPVTHPPAVPVKVPGVKLDATSEGFQRFWNAYPNGGRKLGLAKCWDYWKRNGLEALADDIEAHVLAMAQCNKWREGFEPATMTYLHGQAWNDPIPQAGPKNEARAYLEATLNGSGSQKAASDDADALRRRVPAQVARIYGARNG